MRQERFDTLARALARGQLSRRGLLGALLSLAVSAALAHLRAPRAGAAGCPAGCTPESRCCRDAERKDYCCPDGTVCCGEGKCCTCPPDCAPEARCCQTADGQPFCCQPDALCCGPNTCCPVAPGSPKARCCTREDGVGYCCPPDEVCCGAGGPCCPSDAQCCFGRGSDAWYCCAAPSHCQKSPDGNDAKCCPPEAPTACGSNDLGGGQWEPVCCSLSTQCCGTAKSFCCQPHEVCVGDTCIPACLPGGRICQAPGAKPYEVSDCCSGGQTCVRGLCCGLTDADPRSPGRLQAGNGTCGGYWTRDGKFAGNTICCGADETCCDKFPHGTDNRYCCPRTSHCNAEGGCTAPDQQ